MHKILILPCALLLFAGCSSTQSSSREGGTARYSEQRVHGQRASLEAGLADDHWAVKRVTPVNNIGEAPALAAQPEEKAIGSASVVGTGTTISAGSGGLETVDHADIELRKEELVVGKREVSNGGVLVRTVVQTENVSQPIDLRREEYVIERVPATDARSSADASNAFQGREIYIPLMREEPVTGKRTVLTEAVKVGKRIETDHQMITMPVRTEDVQIVKNPDLSDPRFSNVPRRAAYSTATINGRESTQVNANAADANNADGLKLAKEEFLVGKRDVDNGGVFLQKVVRTQDASQPVDLRREEFVIDRTALPNQPVADADFRERQIKINLTREEAVAGTRNYLAETIRVRKQTQTDNQIVSGTVRKESVEIVKNSDRNLTGQGGTGSSIESGTSSSSESGYPAKSPEKTSDQK